MSSKRVVHYSSVQYIIYIAYLPSRWAVQYLYCLSVQKEGCTVQYSTLYKLSTCPAVGQYSTVCSTIYILPTCQAGGQYSTVCSTVYILPTCQQVGSTVQYAVQYVYYLPAQQVGSTVQYAVQYIYILNLVFKFGACLNLVSTILGLDQVGFSLGYINHHQQSKRENEQKSHIPNHIVNIIKFDHILIFQIEDFKTRFITCFSSFEYNISAI